MQIGPVTLRNNPLLLAPMEDVSDPPFRQICRSLGADLVYTEFISSGGLVHDSVDSLKKLEINDAERPVGIQIFGGEVNEVSVATEIASAAQPDLIDINFGCPVRKIVCKDSGAGILRNITKMQAITEAVVRRTNLPVTVKTRLGWSDDSIIILDVVRMLEDTGVKAVAVHARTRSQMYQGEARWNWLKRIKQESGISIPVFGNGDALSPVKVKAMFDETGVDGVMVGRGAIGNPWIFRETRHYLETGELMPGPSWQERISVVKEHLTLKCEWIDERKGLLEMRRMYGGYFKGFRNAADIRGRLSKETTLKGVIQILDSLPDLSLKIERTADFSEF